MTCGGALSKQEAVNYLSPFTLFLSAYILQDISAGVR